VTARALLLALIAYAAGQWGPRLPSWALCALAIPAVLAAWRIVDGWLVARHRRAVEEVYARRDLEVGAAESGVYPRARRAS
jgi:hypothetical protein